MGGFLFLGCDFSVQQLKYTLSHTVVFVFQSQIQTCCAFFKWSNSSNRKMLTNKKKFIFFYIPYISHWFWSGLVWSGLVWSDALNQALVKQICHFSTPNGNNVSNKEFTVQLRALTLIEYLLLYFRCRRSIILSSLQLKISQKLHELFTAGAQTRILMLKIIQLSIFWFLKLI